MKKKIKVSPPKRTLMDAIYGEKFYMSLAFFKFSPETNEVFINIFGEIISEHEYHHEGLEECDDIFIQLSRRNERLDSDSFKINFNPLLQEGICCSSISKNHALHMKKHQKETWIVIPFNDMQIILDDLDEEDLRTLLEEELDLGSRSSASDDAEFREIVEEGMLLPVQEIDKKHSKDIIDICRNSTNLSFLNKSLDSFIEKEEFENAALVRDIISKKFPNSQK